MTIVVKGWFVPMGAHGRERRREPTCTVSDGITNYVASWDHRARDGVYWTFDVRPTRDFDVEPGQQVSLRRGANIVAVGVVEEIKE